jgi:hypothetical protein
VTPPGPPHAVPPFDAATLELLDREAEVDIVTDAPDQLPRRATIWIVVEDGAVYVRSVRGARGRWWRALLDQPQATLHVAGRGIPVIAVRASDSGVLACSRGLTRKYRGDASLPSMLEPDTLPTTLRLVPA